MALIAVDIGHGADTFPPSKGVYRNGKGYAEHAFNALLGIEVRKLLEKQGHTVIFGQQPFKKDVPLTVRTNLYNRRGVDLIVSLHANWNRNKKVNGRCIFYWGASARSQSLAIAIRDEIGAMGYSTHGNGLHAGKWGSWTNLHINRVPKAPSVLVEHGFMSGNTDFELIFGNKQSEYVKDMAEANVRGIQAWLGESFKGGKPVKVGWKKNNTGWWYVNHDGTYPRNQWKKVSGLWYHFDSRGYMQTGWIRPDDHWYYLNASGAMQRWWFKVGNTWYYANGAGRMQTGWLKDKHGRWFYLCNNGAMATGLLEVNGKHYFLQRNGVLITDEVIELEANKHGHLA